MKQSHKSKENKESLDFLNTVKKLYPIYRETKNLETVMDEIVKTELTQTSTRLMQNFFNKIEKHGLKFTEKAISKMTKDKTRELLMVLQKKEQKKGFAMAEKTEKQNTVTVRRDKENQNQLLITGQGVVPVKEWVKHTLKAPWDKTKKAFVMQDPNYDAKKSNRNFNHVKKLYGRVMSKVADKGFLDIAKKGFEDNANEDTLSLYGRASVLYAETVNPNFLEIQIAEAEKQGKQGKLNMLVATENAYFELKDLGFMEEKTMKVKTTNGDINTPIGSFINFDAKKAFAKNMNGTDDELKTALAVSQEKPEVKPEAKVEETTSEANSETEKASFTAKRRNR